MSRATSGGARRAMVVGAVAVAGLAVVASVRGRGITAVGPPAGRLEGTLAGAAWRYLVPAHVRHLTNPVPSTADVLTEARDHWAEHCALCHDNTGSGQTAVGRRIYPPPPDLRGAEAQRLTDGELFYAIEEGVPWTAMPGWTTGTPDGEHQSWALVRFIRALPALTPDDLKAMEAINPRPPISAETQRETDEFLKAPSTTPRKAGTGRR